MKTKIKRRNPMAKAVRTPLYRQRRVPSGKLYSRKKTKPASALVGGCAL
jgi:hypothetical protein